MDDGTRTHDNRDHNPGLYQLSYVHRRIHRPNGSHRLPAYGSSLHPRLPLACPAGLEPATHLLLLIEAA